MAMTIWKATLSALNIQDIDVPEGAEILTARDQHNEICVWFKCDPSKPCTKRRIAICGTGHPAPEIDRYIGTGFLYGGQLVFHVFERVM